MGTMETPLLTTEEAAAYLKKPAATLRYWRCVKKGPKSLKIGGSRYYHKDDLTAYIDQIRSAQA